MSYAMNVLRYFERYMMFVNAKKQHNQQIKIDSDTESVKICHQIFCILQNRLSHH